MPYTPPQYILDRYADVLVNFSLNGGKGIKKGHVVRVSASESARPLYQAVCKAIIKAGGHIVANYMPDDERSDSRGVEGYTRYFFRNASEQQIKYFPAKYLESLVDTIDHSLFILADKDPHALDGVDPKRIMMRTQTMKPFKDWVDKKQHAGKFTWTLGMYGTPGMAKEAGLSEKAYWDQIIKACFLDEKDPIKRWQQVYKEIKLYQSRLNNLSPKIDRLHVQGVDADLWITLGEKRRWLAGRGFNMPSFEIFTSPDWRGTNGWIRFNQPLYRYGSKITGIQLWWKNGKVVKATAKSNQKLLQQMIATPGADQIGEYSLTDRRHSRITKFMAETLFDENMGGPQGNTHLAVGSSYKDAYAGDVSKLTKTQAAQLGFNDSSVHTDIISTTRRTVTAHLKNGSRKVIYRDGEFVL